MPIYNIDMATKLEEFDNLATIFKNHGYRLFLVGGTVRDYLLGEELTDMDAVSDATPIEIETFLNDADFTFKRFGSVKYKSNGVKFDITTMRKENQYEDSRHPLKIEFIKDLSVDVIRRDFTINAMYLDDEHQVIDYVGGQNDLINRLLRMVGNPLDRIKEDPLRIIRAIRFAIDYDLSFDEELEKTIKENISLLDKLNPEKIKQDLKKIKCSDKTKIVTMLNKFNITHLMNVIE